MHLLKSLKSIFKQMEPSLWIAIVLLTMGASNSIIYGRRLETTTRYILDEQSIILKTLYDIEKFELLMSNHLYLLDKNREKANLEEIKNLKTKIEFLLKTLAKNEHYPQIKLLKKQWKNEVSPLVEAIAFVNRNNVDHKNLKNFLFSFNELVNHLLTENQEIKAFQVTKLKLLRIFNISIIIIAFLILIRKLMVHRLETSKVNDYLEGIISQRSDSPVKDLLKSRQVLNLRRNIDIQNNQLLLIKEQCSDYMDLLQETFIECRPDFSIMRSSKDIKRLLGWESFELENKKLKRLFKSSDDFEELELKYYQNGKKLYNYLIDCISTTGEVIPVSVTLIDYYDKITEKDTILVVLRDYSNEVRLKELTQKSKLLFHNSKMASLGEMSGSIAHEINNPLMIIKGSVSRLSKLLLREGSYSDQIEVLLERLNRMIERVSSIIFVMQSFGETTEHSDKKFVMIKDIISTAVELNAQKLKFQGINFDFAVSNLETQVMVNKPDIDQALLNIISNASEAILKSGIKDGSISLKVVSQNSRVFIMIRNNGESIDSEAASKIFEPFHTSKSRGVGMGLPIAHTLCQRNNVDLSLDCLYPVTFRLEFLGATKA